MAQVQLRMQLNGADVEAWVPEHRTLLDVLRDEIGATEVKNGCGEGVCGTCTVLLDDVPVSACLLLAVQAEGRRVTTVRGLAVDPGGLHPLQQSFLRHGAAQCGFCTPGMLLAAVDLLRRSPRPSRDAIRQAVAGNLCRCTGYTKIVDAIEEYATQPDGDPGPAAAEVVP